MWKHWWRMKMVKIYSAALLILPIIPNCTFENCFQAGTCVWRAHFSSFKEVPPSDWLCLQAFFRLNASYVFHVIWRHHSLKIKPCIQTIKPEAEKQYRGKKGWHAWEQDASSRTRPKHSHTQRWTKTRCTSVSECASLCSWVWTSLQLRREAMAIPSDLKTGSPATLNYGGEGKCQRAQKRWKFKGWDLEILESGNRHTHTKVEWWITGRNRPRHSFVLMAQVKGMKERWDKRQGKWERDHACGIWTHLKRTKNKTEQLY